MHIEWLCESTPQQRNLFEVTLWHCLPKVWGRGGDTLPRVRTVRVVEPESLPAAIEQVRRQQEVDAYWLTCFPYPAGVAALTVEGAVTGRGVNGGGGRSGDGGANRPRGEPSAVVLVSRSLPALLTPNYQRPAALLAPLLEELFHAQVVQHRYARHGRLLPAPQAHREEPLLLAATQLLDGYVAAYRRAWLLMNRRLAQFVPGEPRCEMVYAPAKDRTPDWETATAALRLLAAQVAAGTMTGGFLWQVLGLWSYYGIFRTVVVHTTTLSALRSLGRPLPARAQWEPPFVGHFADVWQAMERVLLPLAQAAEPADYEQPLWALADLMAEFFAILGVRRQPGHEDGLDTGGFVARGIWGRGEGVCPPAARGPGPRLSERSRLKPAGGRCGSVYSSKRAIPEDKIDLTHRTAGFSRATSRLRIVRVARSAR